MTEGHSNNREFITNDNGTHITEILMTASSGYVNIHFKFKSSKSHGAICLGDDLKNRD